MKMADDHLPPAEFRVLLALVDGAKHGHGIKLDVLDRTGGRVELGPGTLYGALKRLLGFVRAPEFIMPRYPAAAPMQVRPAV